MIKLDEKTRLICEFYKIAEDSTHIKRVIELAGKRDIADGKGDKDEVAIIDNELSKYGNETLINKEGV
jgi:hypothetical protein